MKSITAQPKTSSTLSLDDLMLFAVAALTGAGLGFYTVNKLGAGVIELARLGASVGGLG